MIAAVLATNLYRILGKRTVSEKKLFKNKALDNEIKEADGLNIITDQNDISFNSFMSNSFGFGGTNSCLIFEKD